MFKVGKVTAIDEKKCKVRVIFQENDLISAWLPIVSRGSYKTKDYWIPDIDEQVLVGYTEEKEGFILGAFFSDEDEPPIEDKDRRHIALEGGTTIDYNKKNGEITINCAGAVNITAAGNVNVTGDVIADGISLKTHTHGETQSITTAPIGG